MKKYFCVLVCLSVLLVSCGVQENKDTRFLLDTVVTLTAECDEETLDGAFSLCSDFEKMLSRTIEGSDVYELNLNKSAQVSEHTRKIIERSLYYSEKTGGKFDITVCSVSKLWNFSDEIIPEKNEIEAALGNVDYESIEIDGNTVSLGKTEIDLGGIAKGYIADRLVEYFKEKGVKSGIVNLGGNVAAFGKTYTVGIQDPQDPNGIAAKIKIFNKSAVTSGIYQRSFEKDGELYHHILNPQTGYPENNTLSSVTVIGESSTDCDALSTVCMLLGVDGAVELINDTVDIEAIFIGRDGEIILSKGLYMEKNEILFR